MKLPSRPLPKPVPLAVALALGAPLAVCAGPLGPTVVSGKVQLTQPDAATLLIRQDSDKAIINWRSFSIGANERVQFQQPGSGSVALNRVTAAAAPSEIYGSLSANGKVFLINPAGVVFGKGAAVDVGGLVASTLDIRDDDFLAGRYAFTGGGAAGAVRNQGRLAAADGGTIALLGAQVSNEGTISARLGTAGLAAGGKVTLDFGSDGLTRIVVDAARINALVENGGAILSEGGQVTMSARALGALAGTVVNNSGLVSARSLVERNGRIVLDGGDAGKVAAAGTLDASGLAGGQRGGTVTVLGHDIVLAGAAIDARGQAGGGSVLVGGDYRGDDRGGIPAVAHAASTTMEAGSSIRTDALGSGDGGKIVLWSDGATAARGSLSARGGALAGNGGVIETSGRQVDIGGLSADASAPHGKAGSWLLDPADMTIGTPEAAAIAAVLDTGTAATTTSSGSIVVNADITKSAGGDASLTLNAGQDIVVNPGVSISSTSGKLNVDFNANAAGDSSQETLRGAGAIEMWPGSRIATNGGAIRFYGQSDPLAGIAIGDTSHTEGIRINQATLDTRSAGGSTGGQILMRAAGYDLAGGAGIVVEGTVLQSASGNIHLEGQGGTGTGIGTAGAGVEVRLGDFAYGGEISTTSGTISIAGKDGTARFAGDAGAPGAPPFGMPGLSVSISPNGKIRSSAGDILLRGDRYGLGDGDSSAAAVDMFLYGGEISSGGRLSVTGIVHGDALSGLTIGSYFLDTAAAPALSAGGAGMLLAGRGGLGTGLALRNVQATTGAGGQLSVAGESAGGSGVVLDGALLGGTGMSGNVAVRAYSDASATPMLLVTQTAHAGASLSTSPAVIQTSGVVALLPGGVDNNGNLTTKPDVPITVGDSSASGFAISFDELGLGRSGTSRVVVGSKEHRALITLVDATPFLGDLSLQNDGAGSGGIVLDSTANVSGQLTLSSGGKVIASNSSDGPATITAGRLLLHGSMPESNFQLAAANHQVGQFAAVFDRPKSTLATGYGDVSFTNTGALAVNSLNGAGFSSDSNLTANIAAPNTLVAGSLLLQTTGNLTLGRNVSTLDGDITLVTGGIFLNTGNGLLTAGGGRSWRLFADTWAGEVRGNLAPSRPHPNIYGCAYNTGCADGIGGNHFFYRQQPVLTITPDNLARAYGDPNPALTYSANLLNGDTLADAASGGYTTAALPSSPVGSYATAASFTSPVGYQIVALPGSLSVTPAALLVRIDDKSKVYGDADPLLSASLSGFKLGDTAALVTGLTLSTVTGPAATAGSHPITGAGASAPNYSIVYQPGVLSVAKAPLQVNIADQAKTYGDPDPVLTAALAGFRYADSSEAVSGLTLSTVTGKAATAGTHPINGANAGADNYSFVYHPGTLSVARAPLTVLVDDKRKQYGDADPALTYRATGLKYDDTAADTGGVSLSTVTGAAATAGTHPIAATTASGSNYVVSSQPGTLTVDKAPLLLTADDKTKVYGDPEPLFTASASGLKYADTVAVVKGLAFAVPTGAAASAGTHAITPSNGAADNYTLAYQPGTLTVARAALTVSADDKTKVYGAPDPALTATMSGFRYGDTSAVVSGPALSAPTGAAATVGTHRIGVGGASAANYSFDYVPGVLSVEPGVLQYVASPAIRFQDTPSAPLSGSVTGFAYGDTLASATRGVLAFTSAATPQSPPGVYAIQGSGLSAANYRFVQFASNGGALSVFSSPAVLRPTIAKDITFESSNVYDKNFGTPHLCAGTGPLDRGAAGTGSDDFLALEWSRVRVSPNLSNCLGLGQRNGCADF